jgi:iron(II)-dependent oxidoreductase
VRSLRDGAGQELEHHYDALAIPRGDRGKVSLPGPEETFERLASVRDSAVDLLERVRLDPDDPLLWDGFVYNMVVQHESQHQETLLQSLALREAEYPPATNVPAPSAPEGIDDEERVPVPAGPVTVGTDDRSRAYDNERPRHEVDVGPFALDRYPVTVRRWSGFIDDGGYERDDLWSPGGRAWRSAEDVRCPLGWVVAGSGRWKTRAFGVERTPDPLEPVQHVSFWEAEAFARWAGARLPTETEWEKASAWDPDAGRARTYPWGDAPPSPERANLDGTSWRPVAVGSYPRGASAFGVEQLLGDVYEWTSTPFDGYPGFEPFPYPEYSRVFFGGDYRVLRGASWAAAACLARNTYRNWDHPYRRQIFAGVRLAWDLD